MSMINDCGYQLHDIRRICRLIFALGLDRHAYVFGSYANGKHHENSDLDIYFEVQPHEDDVFRKVTKLMQTRAGWAFDPAIVFRHGPSINMKRMTPIDGELSFQSHDALYGRDDCCEGWAIGDWPLSEIGKVVPFKEWWDGGYRDIFLKPFDL